MTVRFSRAGLHVRGRGPAAAALRFADAVLRGFGQVMLQGNAITGLLFLLGIAAHSPLLALAALAGAAVSTATAGLLGAGRASLRRGAYGFNGALVGIALLYFLRPGPLTWTCVVFAAAGSAVLAAAVNRLLRLWPLPALTAPFVLISWCVFLATTRFGRLDTTGSLPTAALPRAATVEGVIGVQSLVDGVLNGIAQVFFQTGALTGGLFLLGLLVASRRAAAMALAASAAGFAVGWWMGAAEPELRAGLYGFNSVLVAVALAGPAASNRVTAAYALLAAAATPFVFASLSAALQPIGLPALTFPFVIVTSLCSIARPTFGRLSGPQRGAAPADQRR